MSALCHLQHFAVMLHRIGDWFCTKGFVHEDLDAVERLQRRLDSRAHIGPIKPA